MALPKIALAALLALWMWAPQARAAEPQAMIAVLPNGTTVEEIAAIDGMAPGLLSAGLDHVPPAQTYIDITQGNRVSESLYDEALPRLRRRGQRVVGWQEVVDRALAAPSDLIPGAFATSIYPDDGVISIDRRAGPEALIATNLEGRVTFDTGVSVRVRAMSLRELGAAAADRAAGSLLIAFAAPPPADREQLAIGIAGPGFDGNLTSDSTRMNGYVLSTDIAPTVLDYLGLPIPQELHGSPIESEDEIDVEAITDLQDRFVEIEDLRVTILAAAVGTWLLIAAVALLVVWRRAESTLHPAKLITCRRQARAILQLLVLSVVWLPLATLIGHIGGEWVERLIVFLLPPALAVATRRRLPGYGGLAVACLVTAGAYAIDVIAGSPLTANSLMGPTPGLGVRFYGIGNTLEATLVPLVIGGVGAALVAFYPRLPVRDSAMVFLAAGLIAAVIFAAGRFGADVGAAIVFPVAAATAAVVVSGGGRSRILLIALVPLAILGVLALIDVLSGGNAHLTRSVLEAGSFDDLADVAERRLTLSAQTFEDAITSPFLPVTLALIGVGWWQRKRIRKWLSKPQYRAAWLGIAVATLVGAVANDSGALLLMVGTAYALALAAFAWAET